MLTGLEESTPGLQGAGCTSRIIGPLPLHRVPAPHVLLPPSSCLKKVPEALRRLYLILEAERE